LREADFLPQPLYLSALKAHSDVVRPFASGQEAALAINPYHLGFTIWERIVAQHGLEKAMEVRRDEDDFGFCAITWTGSSPRKRACSSIAREATPRSASRAATWRRSAKRSSRPSSTTARRASP